MNIFWHLQILTGEQPKEKRPRPILGMLQTSKSFVPKYEDQNVFETIDGTINDDINVPSNHATDKNPILNKRILLKVNVEQSNNIESDFVPLDLEADVNTMQNRNDAKQTISEKRPMVYKLDPQTPSETAKEERISNENKVYDKMKLMKQYSATAVASNDENNRKEDTEQGHFNQGRIVVYGDSNCLDSTHIEKPCFWLLDALLEYTMSSHVSKILKDLNQSPNVQLLTNLATMPKRLPNNNLHLYSKVLLSTSINDRLGGNSPNDAKLKSSSSLKRPIPKCFRLHWDPPIFLNISTSNEFHLLNGRNTDDIDNTDVVDELNLRRKLESQKGEVRSVESPVK